MTLTVEDLEGKYRVSSETSENGPFVVNGDGETEIRNGLTFRRDHNGFIWESSFTVISPTKVKMESTLDPGHAKNNAYVKDAKGNPTNAIVTYWCELDVTKEYGKLVLSGTIEHGNTVTRIRMSKT